MEFAIVYHLCLVNDNKFYGAENSWSLGYLVENRMQNYVSLYCVNIMKKYGS
jgi:hypothetical protein